MCSESFGACMCFHLVGFCCLLAVSKTVLEVGVMRECVPAIDYCKLIYLSVCFFFFQVIGLKLKEEQRLEKALNCKPLINGCLPTPSLLNHAEENQRLRQGQRDCYLREHSQCR